MNPGYLKIGLSAPNDFKINLKFKTKEANGLIFYATDREQNAGISLAIVDGYLKLISQKTELISKDNNFNDSDWHVVSVQHNSSVLRVDYDDSGFRVYVFKFFNNYSFVSLIRNEKFLCFDLVVIDRKKLLLT